MSRDHVEVGRLTEELGKLRERLASSGLSSDTAEALRRILYGLYTLVTLHFAKEEEIYLPLLEAHLTQSEAQAVFQAMEAAAKESA
jgi:iron-sulfur cluster repair protein YtfE (RIC family)